VFKRVRRESPATYLKVCAMLVPRERDEGRAFGRVASLSDEELDQAIAAIRAMLDEKASEAAKVIAGTAETPALLATDPGRDDKAKRPNKVMEPADTAMGPRPRKRKVPLPAGDLMM
jgi:hypothetical protein